MDGIKVELLSRGDLAEACRVLGLAFADSPNSLAIAAGDRGRAERTMRAVARVAKLGRRCSHVLVAREGSAIVGVLNAAEWPSCQLSVLEKIRTSPPLMLVTGSGAPKALRLTSVWAAHDPRRPHWHLGPVGVRPDRQGRGIGHAVLADFLDTVDDQGLPAYLETDVDRNVPLYQKFGFKVVDREDVLGVDNRFMWRDAGRH